MELTINQPFRLADTFTCGQGHRWLPRNDGWYEGVVGAELIRVRQTEAGIEFTSSLDEAAIMAWLHRHFRLDDDVEAIHRELRQRDPVVAGLLEQHSGIRVMRVDPWECLAFFILSANNNIPRIQRDMERIADLFGEPIGGGALDLSRPGGSGPGFCTCRAGRTGFGTGQGIEGPFGSTGGPVGKSGPESIDAGPVPPVGHRPAEDPARRGGQGGQLRCAVLPGKA